MDSTGSTLSLTGLVAVDPAENGLFDWDTSALADWPNIAPNAPAASFTAEPQAGAA
jgi:hypothetical protein